MPVALLASFCRIAILHHCLCCHYLLHTFHALCMHCTHAFSNIAHTPPACLHIHAYHVHTTHYHTAIPAAKFSRTLPTHWLPVPPALPPLRTRTTTPAYLPTTIAGACRRCLLYCRTCLAVLHTRARAAWHYAYCAHSTRACCARSLRIFCAAFFACLRLYRGNAQHYAARHDMNISARCAHYRAPARTLQHTLLTFPRACCTCHTWSDHRLGTARYYRRRMRFAPPRLLPTIFAARGTTRILSFACCRRPFSTVLRRCSRIRMTRVTAITLPPHFTTTFTLEQSALPRV